MKILACCHFSNLNFDFQLNRHENPHKTKFIQQNPPPPAPVSHHFINKSQFQTWFMKCFYIYGIVACFWWNIKQKREEISHNTKQFLRFQITMCDQVFHLKMTTHVISLNIFFHINFLRNFFLSWKFNSLKHFGTLVAFWEVYLKWYFKQ